MTVNPSTAAPQVARRQTKDWGVTLSRAALTFVLLCGPVGLVPPACGETNRRIIRSQPPDYPGILRAKGIGGRVRLRVRVLANGTVVEANILGGNPILAVAAISAVLKWKYEPAPSVGYEIVIVDFDSH